MAEKKQSLVELDELLAAEFSYIAQTASQAFEDRGRISSFYLIAVGSLIAALFGTQFFEPEKFTPIIKLMFSGTFLLLTILGFSTVVQLAKIRAAWHESMLAMNQLKDFAMKQNPELGEAFRWRTSTLPDKFVRGNLSYYQVLEVSVIGGLMFGAAVFFLLFSFSLPPAIIVPASVVLGGGAVISQMRTYKRMLS